jgi:anti-sigma B factor antagonist
MEQIDDITCIVVPGPRLDASQSPAFKREIAAVLTTSPKLIFDLSQVQFIDSTGLGTIVSCLKVVHASGGELKLCSMSKSLRALFELVRMHRVFDIHNSREEAASAFQRPS